MYTSLTNDCKKCIAFRCSRPIEIRLNIISGTTNTFRNLYFHTFFILMKDNFYLLIYIKLIFIYNVNVLINN